MILFVNSWIFGQDINFSNLDTSVIMEAIHMEKSEWKNVIQNPGKLHGANYLILIWQNDSLLIKKDINDIQFINDSNKESYKVSIVYDPTLVRNFTNDKTISKLILIKPE